MSIPYFNIDIKPSAGDILLMPANYLGAHEIHEVTSGSRYSYLGWYAQGSAHSEKGIDPNEPQETNLIGGQWWMPTFLEDYKKYITEKYGNIDNAPAELTPLRQEKESY